METSKNVLDQAFLLCNGIEYTREIPQAAERFAKENGLVIIVGGSDDLMYAYGAESWLTHYIEHGYGWDGEDFTNISDKKLQNEAEQLGLKIWWCGHISSKNPYYKLENYDSAKMGAFSYTVKDGIEFRNFTVLEDLGKDEVYCTGIIIKLPDDFVSAKDLEC